MEFTGERFIPEKVDGSDEITYEHLNRYVSVEDFVKKKVVLDAACGVGYGTHIIAGSAKRVFGIDIDSEAIAYAKEHYAASNITYKRSSVTALPFKDDFFDVVVSFETIEHIGEEDQELFMSEIKRVLKKDGKLIISTPDKQIYNKEGESHNEFHIKEFYANEFYNFLKSRFEHVNFLYQRNEICNIISGSICNEVKIIRKNYLDSTQGKYVIAVCSDQEVKQKSCASVQIHTGEFHKRLQRILDLQKEVEEKNKWAFSLKETISSLEGKLKQAKEELAQLQENLASSEAEKKRLVDEKFEMADRLKNAEASIKALEEELENTPQEDHDRLIGLQKELKKREKKYNKLLKEKEKLKKEIKKLYTKKEIESLEKELSYLNEILVEMQQEYARLNSKLDKKNVALKKAKTEILHLQKTLQDAKHDNRSYAKTIEKQEEELNALKESVEALETGLSESENIKHAQELQIQALKTELDNVRASLSENEEALKESRYVNDILSKQVEVMKNDAEVRIMRMNNVEAYQHLRLKYKDMIWAELNRTLGGYKKRLYNPFKMIKEIRSYQKKLKKYNRYFDRIPRRFLEIFNAGLYLEANEDVLSAVQKGEMENALEHFILFGYDEVRDGTRPLYASVGTFNEQDYLNMHHDVKRAVERGDFASGYDHYLQYGVEEIRKGLRFDKPQASSSDRMDLKIIDPQSMTVSYANTISVPYFDTPLVSIVIPAYNQANYTLACIRSVVENTTTVPYEIIVMDDKSPDQDARNIPYFVQNITFVSNEENLGFLRNCNKGADLAKGKYILFLNNDTNVQPGWLSTLVELIESDEKIGMVGSKLVYPDGRQQEAGGIIWNDASGWNFGRLDDPLKPEYNYVKEADYISGAAIMIRGDLWNEIGGFDERYVPAYYEDSDLAFEVRKHGYKVMLQPKSVVIHFEGVSNGTDLGSGIKRYQVVNYDKFLSKWKSVLEKEHFPNAEHVFLARDRSRNKKHILVIDHYVPHYDQDAGSRTVYAYLKLFVNEGYSVKFIGDNFFPHQPYTEALQQMGVEVLFGPWYANHWKEWLAQNGSYFDYVFMNRPHISEKYIDAVREYTNAKIIYYGHDLHFLREEREYDLTGNRKCLENIDYWKEKELGLMRKSDISYYPSTVEVDFIRSIDASIKAKALPAYLFDDFTLKERHVDQTQDMMFVGGFAHTPNVDAVVWFVKEVWPHIKRKLPNTKFYIIGSKPTEEVMALASDDIIVTGFVSDETLFEYYEKIRLAVVPLRYGAGIKGKVVEALYHQIPIVTTSVGAEGLSDAENHMIVEDDAEAFAQEVISLYNDKKRLSEYAGKGVAYCREHFSFEAAKTALLPIFEFGRDNES